MFCPKCGTSVPEGVKFCQHCGNPMPQRRPIQQEGEAVTTMPSTPWEVQPVAGFQYDVQRQGRSVAALPKEDTVRCPTCGMLAFVSRRRCLICDTDLNSVV